MKASVKGVGALFSVRWVLCCLATATGFILVFNHQVRMKSAEVPWHGKRQRDLGESDWAQVSVDCMTPSDPQSGGGRAVLVEFVRGPAML